MICSPMNAAVRRYNFRLLTSMVFYLVFLVVAIVGFRRYHPSGVLACVLALLPAIAIIASIVVVGAYLAEEKDEFLRNVLIQSLIWGIGATLSVTSVWGFLEMFDITHHLEPFWIYPMFWVFAGIATVPVRLRYR